VFFATSFGLFIFDVNVINFLRLEGQWRKEKDPDPNTLDIGMDSRIRLQIHTIMSWIRNTVLPYEGPMHILFYNTGCTTYIWGFHQGSFPIIAASGGLMAQREESRKQLGPLLLFVCIRCIVFCMVYKGPGFFAVPSERLERGGPCWLLKRGDWGLNNWKGSFLGWFVGLSCRYKRFLFCRLKNYPRRIY
jgi:hypothetical protein